MDNKEFLKKLNSNREDYLEDYEFQKSVLERLIEEGFKITGKISEDRDQNLARMMIQMSICKSSSILNLSEGLKSQITSLNGLVDIHSMSSVYRSLFESYCFFYHLFCKKWSKEKYSIIKNAWEICSLQQRIGMVDKNLKRISTENKIKIESEEKYIKNLFGEMEKLALYQKNEKAIKQMIRQNKWQINFKKNKVEYISWREMYNDIYKVTGEDERFYKLLSLDTHPSYFSVFQFGSLYSDRYDISRRNMILFRTIELLSGYLYNYNVFTQEIFVGLNDEIKSLIEFFGKKRN